MSQIRILLIDDHELWRVGIQTLINRTNEFVISAEADSAADALEQARIVQPHVILLDVNLPERDGIAICKDLIKANPLHRILMLTGNADTNFVVDAIIAGAKGYILKDTHPDELLNAIRRVHTGNHYIDPDLTSLLFEQVRKRILPSRFDALTKSERKVLACMTQAMSSKEIALHLGLTVGTVRNYVSAICQKLGVSNRLEATQLAMREQIQLME